MPSHFCIWDFGPIGLSFQIKIVSFQFYSRPYLLEALYTALTDTCTSCWTTSIFPSFWKGCSSAGRFGLWGYKSPSTFPSELVWKIKVYKPLPAYGNQAPFTMLSREGSQIKVSCSKYCRPQPWESRAWKATCSVSAFVFLISTAKWSLSLK